MFNISKESVNAGINGAVSSSITLTGMALTGGLIYAATKIPAGIKYLSGNVKKMFSSKTPVVKNTVKRAVKNTVKRDTKKSTSDSK